MYMLFRAVTAIAVFATFSVSAAIPGSVNYQGYLTDAGGTPINTDTTITFSIYNVASGGAPLWSTTDLVMLDQGLFSVELGSPGNPFPAGLFDNPLWIGVTLAPDAEMTPRRALTAVGFAFEAENALQLQGQAASAYDQSAHVANTGNPHSVTAVQTGAATGADIASLQSQIDAATALIATLQGDLSAANATITTLQGDLASETSARVEADNDEAVARMAADAGHDNDIVSIQANTVLALDGKLGLFGGDTARFEGVNVQVLNGAGSTPTTNGLGNIIVGYDANRTSGVSICSLGEYDNSTDCQNNGGTWALSHKTGSHNLVVGNQHNYSRYGGVVIGFANSITGNWASASGGAFNLSRGVSSSVSGGSNNIASAQAGSVSGGDSNTAEGLESSVSGGTGNLASGEGASVSGGSINIASGETSSVSGGGFNNASNLYASVSGGESNTASGQSSNVSSGVSNTTSGSGSFVAGGSSNEATGSRSAIVGGTSNVASGSASVAIGGGTFSLGNEAFANNSVIVGGRQNATGDLVTNTVGQWSTIVGGSENVATGDYSKVSGGWQNTASGMRSSVNGGQSNIANGSIATVTGGHQNDADGITSTVGGGFNNTATGQSSVVSGGSNRTAPAVSDWVAGSLFEDF